jgi:IS30 family transposase
LIACLCHQNQARKPHSRGTDRRGQIPDIQSIHIRPPEVEDRLIPGHWEGDLIKGADNRSSVGALVERTTGFVVQAKMDNATTKAVVDSFSAVLNREPAAMRKTMTSCYRNASITGTTGCLQVACAPVSVPQRS